MSSIIKLKNIDDKVAIIDINNPFVGVKCIIDLDKNGEKLSNAVKESLKAITETKSPINDRDLVIKMNEDIIIGTTKIKQLLFKEIHDCSIELSDTKITVTFFDNIYNMSNAEEYIDSVLKNNITTTVEAYIR